MKIGVVMVAYGLADEIRNLFDSVQVQRDIEVEFHLFLHSQHAEVMAACEAITLTPEKGFSYSLHYHAYGQNRGLAKSWNEGMLAAFANGCEAVIIVNDDVVFGRGDVDLLISETIAHPELYMVDCWGWNERLQEAGWLAYSCFALNRVALEKVGVFDENIFPIYFEDTDYAYRAQLAGLEMGHCAGTQVTHGGSMTINSDPILEAQHHETFVRNEAYYVKKWGGRPHEEGYPCPFNNPEIGVRIAPENRHQPYGETYDRTDFEIVKV